MIVLLSISDVNLNGPVVQDLKLYGGIAIIRSKAFSIVGGSISITVYHSAVKTLHLHFTKLMIRYLKVTKYIFQSK